MNQALQHRTTGFIVAANDPVSATKAMSSRDIAELVETRHDSVKRAIERCAERDAITLPPLVEVSNPGPGPKTIGLYMLDKRSSLIVVAQLCPEFTARIVDRWQELEQQAAPASRELSRLEILQLAMESEMGRLAAEAKVAVMAPQVEALHRIAETPADSLNVCMRDAAKHLQVPPMRFTDWLQAIGWTYRRTENSRIVAHQVKINSGHLVHKLVERPSNTHGRVQEPQVRVTPKGLARLALLIEKGEGPK